MSTAAQSIGYEAALKQHYQNVHARLTRRPVRQLYSPPAPQMRQEPPEPAPAPEAPPEPVPAPVVEAKPKEPTFVLEWQAIVRQVCTKYGLDRAELIGTNRRRSVVIARHELFYRLNRERGMGLAQIGRMLGGFDHTTVRNGVLKHVARIAGEVPRWKTRETWTPERRNRAVAMREAGKTYREIGLVMGLTEQGVSSAFNRWRSEAAEQTLIAKRIAQWAKQTRAA